MGKSTRNELANGLIAGALGGLVASWVMNVFMAEAGAKVQESAERLQESVERLTGHTHQGSSSSQSQPQGQSQDQEPKVDATMKTADAVVSAVTGGRHLSMEGKQKGGPMVHYAFGGLMGALYGAMAEYSRAASAGFGTVFASALFAGADLIAVPAFRLSGSSSDAPVSSLATPYAAHLVYGVTTEAVRRVVRAVF